MKLKYFILVFTIFLLTGCWNYRDINDIAIVGALGIDYDKENNLYEVSAQIFNAKKGANGGAVTSGTESPITVYEAKAKTVHEAIRNITYASPKKLYIGHLDIVVFGESFLKEGFINAADFLFRDDESRKDFDILATKGSKASEVLKVLTTTVPLPSLSIRNTIITSSMFKGTTIYVSFDKFIANYYDQGVEATLPVILVEGKHKEGETSEIVKETDPDAKLLIKNTAIFKNDTLIGYLSDNESLGFALIIGNIANTVISFKCDDEENYGSVELNKYQSKIKGILTGNKPSIEIDIKASGLISDYNCKKNLALPEASEEIARMASKRIKELISKTIELSQHRFNSDILGFGDSFYRKNYKYWKKVEKDWYKIFPNIEYKINIDLVLPSKGSIITTTKGGEDVGR